MQKISLNGVWTLESADGACCKSTVPGSVYSFLLENGQMQDPFYRDNELTALKLMESDYCFVRDFIADKHLLSCGQILLRCEGLDTICKVWINGVSVGEAYNMHRIWEFDAAGAVTEGANEIR
ncbi:MAG: glycoside hydrolase family 2 protein, partial [Acetanaerobacterium sp.]